MEQRFFLGEIFKMLSKRKSQIIIFSFIGLMLAGLYTFFFVSPTYESTSKIVVNQQQNTNQTITSTDIQTNLSLINTYQSIIKEPFILEEVIRQTKSDLTVEQLRGMIAVSTEANSLVFGVTINQRNPYMAAELANTVATTFQQKIGEILDVESVTILSTATPSTSPVSPNSTMNLLIGLFLGLMVGITSAYLAELTNKSVQDEKFIETLGWTNLGSILEMSASEINESRLLKDTVVQRAKADRVIRRIV